MTPVSPRAFSSKVDAGLRRENATKQELEHFPAKWMPVCVAKMRPNKS
jgi:hypothetical protein